MLNWFNAREAADVGTALADDFFSQTQAVPAARGKNAGTGAKGKGVQKLLQRVDREARTLQLNFYKRAKLATSFKWRLLQNGVQADLVDELTRILVFRLSVN